MQPVLKPKKTPRANLERNRFLYFEIGLVITLALVFTAFNLPKGEEQEEVIIMPDSSDPYVAKEVYMFKPLPEKIEVASAKAPKKTVVKQPVTQVKLVPEVPKPIIVPVTVELPKLSTDTVAKPKSTEPLPEKFIKVDRKPQFPGGDGALTDYLNRNIVYVDFARKNNYSGVVNLAFTVGADGKVRNVVVLKGVRNSGLDQEIIRVFSSMPLWTPGYWKGKPVDFNVTFPFKFELE